MCRLEEAYIKQLSNDIERCFDLRTSGIVEVDGVSLADTQADLEQIREDFWIDHCFIDDTESDEQGLYHQMECDAEQD